MNSATLEHANITVRDPDKTAKLLCSLFDWQIRWEGDAKNNGRSVHVGAKNSYLALYAGNITQAAKQSSYDVINGLNHVGVVVDNLDLVEERIKSAGFETTSHADYEPGRRFYFEDDDGLEIEVISYS